MTDLRSAAIREAGARALYANHYFTTKPNIRAAHSEWDRVSPESVKDGWRRRWDQIAAELAPIIQQETVREQMRGGSYDADEEAPE